MVPSSDRSNKLIADFRGRKLINILGVLERRSGVLEDYRKIPQPRDRLARGVTGGFPQDRVMGAVVEVNDDSVCVGP